jgi:hypothetical protein
VLGCPRVKMGLGLCLNYDLFFRVK